MELQSREVSVLSQTHSCQVYIGAGEEMRRSYVLEIHRPCKKNRFHNLYTHHAICRACPKTHGAISSDRMHGRDHISISVLASKDQSMMHHVECSQSCFWMLFVAVLSHLPSRHAAIMQLEWAVSSSQSREGLSAFANPGLQISCGHRSWRGKS
jgi:hypothetical protein